MELRYRIEWLGLKVAIALIRMFPLDAASWVCGKLWRLFAPFNGRHARALAHLEASFPDKNLQERQRIAFDMWENLGRVMAESLQLDRILAQPDRVEVDFSHIAETVAAHKGNCVVVSMHHGNWELGGLGAGLAGMKPAGIYQALSNPLSDRLLQRYRKPLYPAGLYPKGHQTARRILSHVRAGGACTLMADLRDGRGVEVSFFGHSAYATPFPATLARATGAPIIAGRVTRLEGARFRIDAQVVECPVTTDRKADIQAATQNIHDLFEKWIREDPAQWMWIHRKWAKPKRKKRKIK